VLLGVQNICTSVVQKDTTMFSDGVVLCEKDKPEHSPMTKDFANVGAVCQQIFLETNIEDSCPDIIKEEYTHVVFATRNFIEDMIT
jgi:hypothetical protein